MDQDIKSHIEALARAGVVTHLVANPGPVDSLFAISKLQDLPEVRFAAAFGDGMVALGCPDGLPDAIAEIAEPVQIPPAPAAPPAPDLAEQLTTLTQKVEALASKPAEPAAPDPALGEKLDSILQALADAPAPGADPALAQMTQQLAAIASQLSGEDYPPAPLGETAEQILARLDGLEAQIAAPAARDPDVQAMLARLEVMMNDAPDLPTHLDRLHDRLDTLAPPKMDETIVPRLGQLSTAIEAIHHQLASLTERLDTAGTGPDLSQDFARIDRHFEALNLQLGSAPDLAPMEEALSRILSELAGLTESPALADLTSRVEEFAQRPLPAPDLSALQTDIAGLVTAMQQVTTQINDTPDLVTPLEHIVARLDALPTQDLTGLQQDIAGITEALNRFTARVVDAPDITSPMAAIMDRLDTLPTPDFTALQQEIAGMKDALEQVTARTGEDAENGAPLSAIMARLDAMPEPDFNRLQDDITEVKATLQGRFAQAPDVAAPLADILTRLDAVPQRLQQILPPAFDPAPLTDELAAIRGIWSAFSPILEQVQSQLQDLSEAPLDPIVARPETLVEGLASQPADDNQPDLAAMLDALPERVRDALPQQADLAPLSEAVAQIKPAMDALQTRIDALTERADPAVGLGKLRQSLSLISEAMASLIDRMDSLTSQNDLEQLADIAAQISALKTMLDRPAAATEPAAPGSEIESLRAEIAALSETLTPALTDLASQMQTLVARPDPTLDLTDQRQSFALFITAMARIERISDALAALPERDGVLVDKVEGFETHVRDLIAEQDSLAQSITGALGKLSDQVALVTPMTEEISLKDMSLDDVVGRFADLLAMHLKIDPNAPGAQPVWSSVREGA